MLSNSSVSWSENVISLLKLGVCSLRGLIVIFCAFVFKTLWIEGRLCWMRTHTHTSAHDTYTHIYLSTYSVMDREVNQNAWVAAGPLGGAVGWASDSISAQVMIPGCWDRAWNLLGILSVSPCPSPRLACTLSFARALSLSEIKKICIFIYVCKKCTTTSQRVSCFLHFQQFWPRKAEAMLSGAQTPLTLRSSWWLILDRPPPQSCAFSPARLQFYLRFGSRPLPSAQPFTLHPRDPVLPSGDLVCHLVWESFFFFFF